MQQLPCQRNGEDKRQNIGDRLTHLYTYKSIEMGQKDNEGDEENTIAGSCQNIR